jgi:type III secretion protein J
MRRPTPGARTRRGRRAWLAIPAVLLALFLVGCSKTELYSGLTERDANEMLALLLRAGIATEKATVKAGSTISVDNSRVPEAVSLVNAAGLPHSKFANIGDLFKKEGMISSPSEERVRYMYGITQELSRTLSRIDGVLDARVHVVLPGNDPTNHMSKPSSAAVLIRHGRDAGVDQLVPKIKELVVNSIEGLNYERVSVVLVKAQGDDLQLAAAALPASDSPIERYLPYALGGVLTVSLLGNAALAYLLWRPAGQPLKTVSTVT